MSGARSCTGTRAAIISAPWSLANRPSLALGVLKAALGAQGVSIDAHHLHLEIATKLGLATYHRIAMQWRLGEALYSALLVPEEKDRLLEILQGDSKDGGRQEVDWIDDDFCSRLEEITWESLKGIDAFRCGTVGFSVCHLQLSASLFMARIIKEENPTALVVLGGRGVVGHTGVALLDLCPDVDIVVDGEGEDALLGICRLSSSPSVQELKSIPNLWFRDGEGKIQETVRVLRPELDGAPPPDFSEYFDSAARLSFPPSSLVLPIEGSRGCSWEHRQPAKGRRGCAFCSLNRHLPLYREKTLAQVTAEIEHLVARHRVLNLSFADSCLPKSYRKKLLKRLIASDKDFTLFCELRPDFDEETIALLAALGMRKIQLGIESFSSRLLFRIGKGVRVIDNVQCLKLCEEYGVPYQYNLLTHVPGMQREEMVETIHNLPLLYAFRTPNLVPLFLGRDSRMFVEPECFGIVVESIGQEPCSYLPTFLADAQLTEETTYRSEDEASTREFWSEVEDLVEMWGRRRQAMSLGRQEPLLSYRDGGDFVLINDLRGAEPAWFTLEGDTRAVFLSCLRIRNLAQMGQACSGLSPYDIQRISEELVEQKLILREGPHRLALPIHASLSGGCGAKGVSPC